MRVLIVGCGYVGLPLGAELGRLGHEVFGLRRSPTAEDELKAAGIQPLLGDVTRPETLATLPRDFDWVVNCVAAGGNAENYRAVYLQGTRHLLEWLAPHPPRKFVYTSSTSVYAQNDGSLVDEASPAEPLAETSRILVATENILLAAATSNLIKDASFPLTPALSRGEREKRSQISGTTTAGSCSKSGEFSESDQRLFLLPRGEGQDEGEGSAHPSGFPAVILRVAGIYGPERGHWFKQFLKGAAHIEGDGSRCLNMIHRDDLVGCIIAALKNGRAGEIYNAADNEPVSQLRFFQWLAQAVDKPMPPAAPENPDAGRRRGVTNKRVSNRKLKQELGYQFKHPTFREGCRAELLRLNSGTGILPVSF